MKLLLISNSTNAGEEYLRYPLPEIGRFLDGDLLKFLVKSRNLQNLLP